MNRNWTASDVVWALQQYARCNQLNLEDLDVRYSDTADYNQPLTMSLSLEKRCDEIQCEPDDSIDFADLPAL